MQFKGIRLLASTVKLTRFCIYSYYLGRIRRTT